ncbi:MAG: hypothetical protein Q7K54_04430 [Candidatus Parcubacteria bacterium]|nr:hypothetical protein [Candidatus Parcubacteria bacterium]
MNHELGLKQNDKIKRSLIEYLKFKDEQGDPVGLNEDLVSKILAKGDAAELADLRLFWRENGRTVSEERMGVFSYYEKLRQQVHQENEVDFKKRKTEAPEKTAEEQVLGFYLEQIEPQVRSAVLNLNRKGYKTQGSGFGPENVQNVYCVDEQFQELSFSADFLTGLKKQGVDLIIKPRSITFRLNKRLSLIEIEAIWLKIEKEIKSKNESLT